MNVKVLVPVVLLGCALPAHAAQRIVLKVSPSVAYAPANLFVRATVDVNPENRSLEIIAESEDFYRSSEIALEGDRAPRITELQFRALPGGTYDVRAVLRGDRGQEIASTGTEVNVVGSADLR